MFRVGTYPPTPEPIIEYLQEEGSPVFSYENDGAINIYASETKLVWRTKNIKINSKMYYNDKKFSLLLFSYAKNIVPCFMTIPSEVNVIPLRNIGLLPRLIRKGTLLGKAILVPSIQCHMLELEKDIDLNKESC